MAVMPTDSQRKMASLNFVFDFEACLDDINTLNELESNLLITYLRYAKHIEVPHIRNMLDLGIHINHQNKHGYSAILLAAWSTNPSLEALSLLLERGASIDVVSKCG